MPPARHYSQEPDRLHAQITRAEHGARLHVNGGGFVTQPMMRGALAAVCDAPREVLLDLRDVAGYEHACVDEASAWIERASQSGVRAVAVIAHSSVVRTLSDVASRYAGLPIRAFTQERAATEWLAQCEQSQRRAR